MELDEMKTQWQAMSARLQGQELFSQKIIREMILSRSQESITKLTNLEYISMAILLASAPFFVWLSCLRHSKITPFFHIGAVITSILILAIFIPWTLKKIITLSKIDNNSPIEQNMHLIRKYKILIQWEAKATLYFVAPFLICWGIYIYSTNETPYWLWTYFFCCLGLMVILGIRWWKNTNKRIRTIEQSLDELKELDETDEA